MTARHRPPVPLLQATQDTPSLAKLIALSDESRARLKAIEGLVPPALRCGIHAGPIEGPIWCLILDNNAIAAKLRQLLPTLAAHLRTKGWEVNAIRLKVQISSQLKR